MNWLRNFMLGRYGFDQLSFAILIVYLIVMLIVNLFRIPFAGMLAFALVIWVFFRMLSRNTTKRRAENEWFLKTFAPMIAWFRNIPVRSQARALRKQQKAAERAERKQFCHFKCEQCGQILRVPRGKGKIRIHCPKCGHEFIAKS